MDDADLFGGIIVFAVGMIFCGIIVLVSAGVVTRLRKRKREEASDEESDQANISTETSVTIENEVGTSNTNAEASSDSDQTDDPGPPPSVGVNNAGNEGYRIFLGRRFIGINDVYITERIRDITLQSPYFFIRKGKHDYKYLNQNQGGTRSEDPPEDGHSWKLVKNHQAKVLNKRRMRALDGHTSLIRDPAYREGSGEHREFQMDQIEKRKVFQCSKPGCEANKWTNIGEKFSYRDVPTNVDQNQRQGRELLYQVWYRDTHNHLGDDQQQPTGSAQALTQVLTPVPTPSPAPVSDPDPVPAPVPSLSPGPPPAPVPSPVPVVDQQYSVDIDHILNSSNDSDTSRKASTNNDQDRMDDDTLPVDSNNELSDEMQVDVTLPIIDEEAISLSESGASRISLNSPQQQQLESLSNDNIDLSSDAVLVGPSIYDFAHEKQLRREMSKQYSLEEESQKDGIIKSITKKYAFENWHKELLDKQNQLRKSVSKECLLYERDNSPPPSSSASSSSTSASSLKSSSSSCNRNDDNFEPELQENSQSDLHKETYYKILGLEPRSLPDTNSDTDTDTTYASRSHSDTNSDTDTDTTNELDDQAILGDMMNKYKAKPPKQKRHFRSFINRDGVSCWINSCIQLLLSAIDHMSLDNIQENRSALWKELWNLRSEGRSGNLDPSGVKNILFEAEKKRIIQDNISPHNRHFHFLGTTTVDENELSMISEENCQQEDCQEFFMCLWDNIHHWLDVALKLKTTVNYFIWCTICKDFSVPPADLNPRPYITLPCPKEDMTMDELVEKNFNSPETKTNWKHDKCKIASNGKQYQRIKDLDEVEFILFVVQRVNISQTGRKQKMRTRLTVTKSIDIVDTQNQITKESNSRVKFAPIAVIHHKGDARGGHYLADIHDDITKKWIRTSDNNEPKEINFKDVSKEGYIFLYKKINKNTQN